MAEWTNFNNLPVQTIHFIMANFVKGSKLNHEIDSLFENAFSELIIVSPFIKLHNRQKDALRDKINDPKFNLTLVFGKNESNKSRSLGQDDFEFFKQFANVRIYYEPRLHAKYYANDDKGILSSMNLYEYSQNHNIEFGVVTEWKLLNAESLDNKARDYFLNTVIPGSALEYQNEPVFESNMLGLSKKYIRSEVRVDALTEELSNAKIVSKVKPDKSTENKSVKPSTDTMNGYCIRTGEQIPFDLTKPYTDKAFKSWSRYKNEDFAEKFCHFSGEPSEGKTTMTKPILGKHWKAAKKEFNL